MHVSKTPRPFRSHQRHPVVLFTYGVALLAWVLLATRRLPVAGSAMPMHMAAPGMPEAMALSNGAMGVGLYLLVWGIMMTAMMYPSAAHAFRAYYDAEDPAMKARKAVAVGTMMSTYTLVWLLTGLVSLAFNLVVPIADIAPKSRAFLLAATLLVLSAYQLSSAKRRHLKHCRTPSDDFGGNVRGGGNAVRSGWRLSLDSVGCCWALMALMVVVGSMNLLWMVAITVLISVEILARDGERLARGIGLVSGIVGVGLVVAGII
jgi:predicted metal-binding membrane protein